MNRGNISIDKPRKGLVVHIMPIFKTICIDFNTFTLLLLKGSDISRDIVPQFTIKNFMF